MANTWPEVQLAASENRRELTLHGQEISRRIKESGIDEGLFDLSLLNFLDISKTCLSDVGSGVGLLTNLTDLVLHNNNLTSVPNEITKLTLLKLLDVSNNQITSFPEDISSLTNLQTLNVSMNKLTEFPAVGDLGALHIFNISHNQMEELPEGIFSSSLVHLSKIIGNDNVITELSGDIVDLAHLNTLDLSNNKLLEVPSEMSECAKLKELNLKGNKFKDRRFGKMVDQCGTKSVLDYLATQLKKEREQAGKKGKGKKKKGGKKEQAEVEDIIKNMINILHFAGAAEAGCTVQLKPAVLSVRQYIVCCIVRELDFQQSVNLFKNFITLQTKLHDGVCQKRQAATIATHDLKSVKRPLTYEAMFPHDLKIVPLFKKKEVTGEKLVADLRKEAEDYRREKKRNTLSGIHQYLDLLKDKVQYPCLLDGEGDVISFPPITNSDKTKISKETTELFIEVTSSMSLDVCKKAMDELLLKMLELGCGARASKGGGDEASARPEADNSSPKRLVVEQVRILDSDTSMKVVYPSRADLPYDSIDVIRSYDD
ncbi:leucine-rich repeat-containing protein 47-like [Pecten maximus]|uniref:leucine-rich repeat-containing protein 47-like n=1 Tax=Pecten maximus TaxID=6579 RepID=UPI001457FEAA|nr:leucine-rich repeat-containing protein 47-like [Pecten maximus]